MYLFDLLSTIDDSNHHPFHFYRLNAIVHHLPACLGEQHHGEQGHQAIAFTGAHSGRAWGSQQREY